MRQNRANAIKGLFFLGLSVVMGCRDSSDPVIVKVGSQAITQSEFRRKLSEVSQSYQSYVLTPNGRKQFLDILIREKLILSAALKSDVPQSSEFKSEMERLKAEEAERLREGRDYLLARLWVEQLRGKGELKSTDGETRQYYDKYPSEVQVRHVLLANADEAGDVAKKIRAGVSFAAMAKAKSLDAATGADGGKMPPAIYGEIIPELEDIVFRMHIGEVSGPIKTKLGYHVLKKDFEKKLSFGEAQERISRLLEKQKLDRYLQSVQEKFPVEVVDDQFK